MKGRPLSEGSCRIEAGRERYLAIAPVQQNQSVSGYGGAFGSEKAARRQDLVKR
jgi:hypothetical protein